MVNFPCPTTCPEVQVKYKCDITSQVAQWNVSGDFGGQTTYSKSDSVGLIKQISSFFTANKTGSTSFSVNFTADVEFNNSVIITCQDLTNGDSKQCIVELEGKRGK